MKEIGINLLSLFLSDEELDWLEMINKDDNPYSIARTIGTEIE